MALLFDPQTIQRRDDLETAWRRIEQDEVATPEVLWLMIELRDAWQEIDDLKAAQVNKESVVAVLEIAEAP